MFIIELMIINIGKKIRFLNTFTEEKLTEFFKKQIDIDS